MKGKIEGTTRRGRRRKQILDKFKNTRRYWKLKEEALNRTLANWFWKRNGHVVGQALVIVQQRFRNHPASIVR
jgi:hypothetical protein